MHTSMHTPTHSESAEVTLYLDVCGDYVLLAAEREKHVIASNSLFLDCQPFAHCAEALFPTYPPLVTFFFLLGGLYAERGEVPYAPPSIVALYIHVYIYVCEVAYSLARPRI